MKLPILYEDGSIVIVDKPSGVVVNRAESVKGITVQDWMEKTYPQSFEDQTSPEFSERSGVVHRLDKDTSGVLVLAKNPASFEIVKNQFKSREVTKKYAALVHGKVEPPEGSIHAPIGRLPWNRMRFGVFTGGRDAFTDYTRDTLYKGSDNDDLTLLTVTPHTGRTHQIRVHLQYINHPIVGDMLYGGRKTSKKDNEWCSRIFLHAKELRLKSPESGKELTIISPLPDDLQKILRTLTGF